MTKAKIETVVGRLDWLRLEENKGDAVDDSESRRRTKLSELVASPIKRPDPYLNPFSALSRR